MDTALGEVLASIEASLSDIADTLNLILEALTDDDVDEGGERDQTQPL